MNTKIFNLSEYDEIQYSEKICEAAEIITRGGLVAFPTETVYGLGANAFDEQAVKNIFVAKGRPSDNPLIVHISDAEQIHSLVLDIPDYAQKLIERFWPGALTIILKKKSIIPDIVSAGLDTVGVRMPNNKIALDLISSAKVPVAAPSANISGKPSPTRGLDCVHDLSGRVDGIIIGDNCDIGVESTVLDATVYPPVILRPGGVTPSMIKACIGDVSIHSSILAGKSLEADLVAKSPGMKYKHYSPNAEFYMLDSNFENTTTRIIALAENALSENKTVGIMCREEHVGEYVNNIHSCRNPHLHILSVGRNGHQEEFARKIFSTLRDFDLKGCDIIFSENFDGDDLGLATMNRLHRVAADNLIK